ncbi:MAG: serine hydrolase domain-containing protein [Thermodesulfobacteriota bacterium]
MSDAPRHVPADVPAIEGRCDARFRAVRDAFAGNFALHGELGAAVTLVVEGRVVVDLWAGTADPAHGTPWRESTLVNVFSVTKALVTICALRLVEQGRLDLDAPLARVWPAFAGADKEQVTLRHVLAHRAGLPALRAPLPAAAMLDWAAMTGALERQAPWWPPGTAHGYHVNTFGFLVGKAVRRASGRSVGAFLRDQVAGPLEADVMIGVPRSEHGRIADFRWNAQLPLAPADPAALPDDAALRYCAYFNPPGLSGENGWVNTPAWRLAEIPSANGHATARGIARVYAALAAGLRHGRPLDGVHVLARETLEQALVEHSAGMDLVLERPSRFGLGFQLTQPERPLGPNPRAFGHFGSGGALGFCDPDADLALGYVMNDMGPRWQNPRNRALLDAIYASL